MNIKRYVNQPEFGALNVNLSHANKCSVQFTLTRKTETKLSCEENVY